MRKKPTISSPIRQAMMLISIPLALSSTGYALFSQQLSVTGNASNPAYSASQNLSLSYTKNISPAGGSWSYVLSVTITNNGSEGVTAWRSDFSLPSDYADVNCTNSSCSQSAGTNTATNTGSNGTIGPGGTVSYDFSFTTAEQNYTFTSIAVSGTVAPTYGPVTGLTVAAVPGLQTQQGQRYSRPYTFSVMNNSGRDISSWRIAVPWDSSTKSVGSMPASVNYTEGTTQLTILSTQPILNNTTFQFTANLESTDSNWVMSGYTIEGHL